MSDDLPKTDILTDEDSVHDEAASSAVKAVQRMIFEEVFGHMFEPIDRSGSDEATGRS